MIAFLRRFFSRRARAHVPANPFAAAPAITEFDLLRALGCDE